MSRIDNDLTKGLAVPFLILAHVRTGGTFCAHALSNHPRIYCDRGETLHHLSAWRRAGVKHKAIMQTIWGQDGYHAAGFRSIYRQAFNANIWPFILAKQPKIIHLTRRDVARQGVSYGYQQLVRQGVIPFHPVHGFETRRVDPAQISAETIVNFAVKVRNEMKVAKNYLSTYPGEILEITYEEMTGGYNASYVTADVVNRISDFLGVPSMFLSVGLRRDFDVPMSEWFSNWKIIRAALEKAGFKGLDG